MEYEDEEEKRERNLKFHLTQAYHRPATFHALSPDDDLSLITLSAVAVEKYSPTASYLIASLIVSICPHIHQIK